MDAIRQSMSSGIMGSVIRIVFILLGLYLLYVLYDFMYSTSDLNDYVIYNGVTLGRPLTGVRSQVPAATFTNTKDTQKIFKIATGSDFSVSFWMYYKDTSYEYLKNKFIFSLGSPLTPAKDQSLLVYIGNDSNRLVVRTNASVPTASTSPQTSSLSYTNVEKLFNPTTGIPTLDDMDNDKLLCSIKTIDFQKWVLVNIVSSQKTLDIYIDGKLGRSCILPDNIRIPKDYQLNMFSYNGFGGYVSNFSVHDYALNPEQTWRMYMAGPGFKYGLLDYISALFDPKSVSSYKYPAYPGNS